MDNLDASSGIIIPQTLPTVDNPEFNNLLAGISPTPISDSAIINQYIEGLSLRAKGQFEPRSNPSNIYQIDDQNFHAVWLNSDISISGQGRGITWPETLKNIGNREVVNQVLNVMSRCFAESGKVFDWKNKVQGFYVESGVKRGGELCINQIIWVFLLTIKNPQLIS